MNGLDLKNNALFLSCWHERNRPVQLICFSVIILSSLLLGCLTIATGASRYPGHIVKNFFALLVVSQSLILLVQGSLFAWNMGAREKSSGTLDFHRSSPEGVFQKIGGLIFGSTWVEWIVFACFFVMEIFCAIHPDITLVSVLLFNISLIVTGIFLHTAGVTLGMLSSGKKKGHSLLGLLLFLWLLGPLFAGVFAMMPSFTGYILGLSGFQYLFPKFLEGASGHFFTFRIPVLLLQIFIQVPLTLLFINGLRRIFSKPNSPAWSKEDILRFCFLILFLTTGFFVAGYTNFSSDEIVGFYAPYGHSYGPPGHSIEQYTQGHAWSFLLSFVFIGILMSASFVPTYFKSSKYELLKCMGKIKKRNIFDDGYSGWPAVAVYSMIGGVLFLFYVAALKIFSWQALAGVVLISSYAVGSAGFVEFFRLSRFRQNKIFFMTVVLGLWVFSPWMIALLFNLMSGDSASVLSISPFVGVTYGVGLILDQKGTPFYLETFLTPWFLAGFMWFLAVRERQALKQHVAAALKE